MPDCTTRAFDGCSCAPDQCQSASHRLDDINRKIKLAEAKRRADRALLTFVATLCIGVAVFGFGYALVKLDKQIETAGRV